jgi:hypothetical protein
MQLGSGEISSHITMSLLIVNRKLLLLSLKTLSIFWNSGAILNDGAILSRSPFALFVLLYSSSWRLPMQLLSGKL